MRKKGAPSHGICSKFFSCRLSSWEELHHEEELEASWEVAHLELVEELEAASLVASH